MDGEEVDYAAEGLELLRRVNLNLAEAPQRYDHANAIYKHPETGALLYVGNAQVATSKLSLTKLGISRIVFCQDRDGDMAFANDPSFRYLPFPIGMWREGRGALRGWQGGKFHGDVCQNALAFFEPLFTFVDVELAAGQNVLIHCLAGAHRAGSAGIACLMHRCKLSFADATALAQTARPAIQPIGGFPRLLGALEAALANKA